MQFINLFESKTGVSAVSTLAGFNICSYAGGNAREEDIALLEQRMSIKREHMYFPVQTHSSAVRRVPCPANELQGVDAVVTNRPDTLIGVHTADCLPLLMADCAAGVIAAVHCGWRGIVGGIVGNAVEAMTSLGAKTERIAATFGPHICAACFEVGEEVAEKFCEAAVIRKTGHKPHVSLADAVARQLNNLGITEIERTGLCSKCDTRFYSVRRQGYTLGERTLTAICLAPTSER